MTDLGRCEVRERVGDKDETLVTFDAIEERVDDPVNGWLEQRAIRRRVGRPAADLLEDETRVERQTAPGKRLFDGGELRRGEIATGAVQPLAHQVDAQLAAERKDLDEVR